jgi:hypothetical protein
MIDWKQIAFEHKTIKVRFTPRPQYKDRAALDGILQHSGQIIEVTPLWLQDDEDPYPGEWALGSPKVSESLFDRVWIASGDVTPLPDINIQLDEAWYQNRIPLADGEVVASVPDQRPPINL